MRGRIFISYRRDDARGDARSIHDRLARKFGDSNVFMDVDSLLAGQRFDRELDRALAQCDVLIAVIGPRWMEALAEKAHGEERDYVREEIAAALKRDIVVIPVLVGQEGRMPPLPRVSELPDDIRDLVMHQRHNIAHESFGRDVDDLLTAINVVRRGERPPRRWAVPAAVAATLLVLAAAGALAYRADVLPWPRAEDTTFAAKKAADDAARKAAEEEAARKSAAEEGRRKAEEEAGLKIAADCDRLAASPTDTSRPNGLAGIDFAKIDAAAATAACNGAMRRYPAVARFIYQAGRAAHARKDYAQAIDLYRRAVDKDSVAAMVNLGFLYANGQGVKQDYAEARRWYEKSAALGNTTAMNNLGMLYNSGQGVKQDHIEARNWYEKAAALENPIAMTNLGVLYDNGHGVKRDYSEARKWYEKAAALGNTTAMTNLGVLYDNGQGVKQDYIEARNWYEKAAALENPIAMTNLGMLYNNGHGVKQDYVEARKWYEKAAALGNAGAMVSLGMLYDNGQGVAQSYTESRKWFEKAAALGNTDAMYNLGIIYEFGQSVSKNLQLARNWYQRAADAGHEPAKTKLANLK